jgi:hypothetical protein
MYARGTLVDKEYQYDSNAEAGEKGGTVDPDKRQVNQCDIDALGLDKLEYNSEGKANLGSNTGQFHEENE